MEIKDSLELIIKPLILQLDFSCNSNTVGKNEKLIERLLSNPKGFTWDELVKILSFYGYKERKGGKTGGSRRKFVDGHNNIISLHKPHPSNIVKTYAINDIIEHLITSGKLKR